MEDTSHTEITLLQNSHEYYNSDGTNEWRSVSATFRFSEDFVNMPGAAYLFKRLVCYLVPCYTCSIKETTKVLKYFTKLRAKPSLSRIRARTGSAEPSKTSTVPPNENFQNNTTTPTRI